MPRCILTLLGPDQPGIVSLLADRVRQRGGNWLNSRMIRLAGQFSGILEVDLPGGGGEGMAEALEDLRQAGYAVSLKEADAASAPLDGPPWRIRLQGNDRPGIVHEVSRAVAAVGGNVEEWESRVTSAPMSGGALFELDGLVRLPGGCDADALRQALESISADLAVDITLEQAG